MRQRGIVAPMPRVGCSGWDYAAWRGAFYPEDLPSRAWLAYYSSRFDTVEVNGTFYRLPEAETFAEWRSQTPRSFAMAIKASRFLTHMKRLREPAEPLRRLFTRAASLRSRLGPMLYQLPPNMTVDLERLDRFLAAASRTRGGRGLRHVVEFRHPSWYVADTYALLERHGATMCLHDKLGSAVEEPFVGPLVYVRFHGTSGRYHGSYGARRLDRWAQRLAEQSRSGRPVYAYFNNDPGAAATKNALALRSKIERLLGLEPRPRSDRRRRGGHGGCSLSSRVRFGNPDRVSR